jgi:hypothetical protein
VFVQTGVGVGGTGVGEHATVGVTGGVAHVTRNAKYPWLELETFALVTDAQALAVVPRTAVVLTWQ